MKNSNRKATVLIAIIISATSFLNAQENSNPKNNTGLKEGGRDSILLQISPQSFSKDATIQFFSAENFESAEIIIYSRKREVLKKFKITSAEIIEVIDPNPPYRSHDSYLGRFEIKGSTLPAGSYTYTLSIDGKAVGSKQMILTK